MTQLTQEQVQYISGGNFAQDAGYAVGYSIGYVVSGNAGRDLGSWLYDKLN